MILGIFLDLYSTRIAISRGFVETRPLGNNPLLEFTVNSCLYSLLWYLADKIFVSPAATNKHKFFADSVLVFWAFWPYLFVIYNTLFMYGVI